MRRRAAAGLTSWAAWSSTIANPSLRTQRSIGARLPAPSSRAPEKARPDSDSLWLGPPHRRPSAVQHILCCSVGILPERGDAEAAPRPNASPAVPSVSFLYASGISSRSGAAPLLLLQTERARASEDRGLASASNAARGIECHLPVLPALTFIKASLGSSRPPISPSSLSPQIILSIRPSLPLAPQSYHLPPPSFHRDTSPLPERHLPSFAAHSDFTPTQASRYRPRLCAPCSHRSCEFPLTSA